MLWSIFFFFERKTFQCYRKLIYSDLTQNNQSEGGGGKNMFTKLLSCDSHFTLIFNAIVCIRCCNMKVCIMILLNDQSQRGKHIKKTYLYTCEPYCLLHTDIHQQRDKVGLQVLQDWTAFPCSYKFVLFW